MNRLIKFSLSAAVLFLMAMPAVSQGSGFRDAGKEYYEQRLDRGLFNADEYAYHLIRRAGLDEAGTQKLLEKAAVYSPNLPAVYFRLSAENCSSFSGYGCIEYFIQGLKAYNRNFWWRFSLSGFFYLSLVVSYISAMLLFVLIRYPSEIRLLLHDVKEERRLAFLFLLPLIVSILGPFAFVAGIFFVTGLYHKGSSRYLVYFSFAMLLVSPFIERGAVPHLEAPSRELRAVVNVNEGRDNIYALSFLSQDKGLVPSFSLALALKREGRYDDSLDIYKRLSEEMRVPAIDVNIGNIYYAKGDPEGAVRYYLASLKTGQLVTAYYNLSQVKRELFDFAKADEYFLNAARIDHGAVSRFNSVSAPGPNRFVVDETFTVRDISAYVDSTAIKGSGLRELSALAVAACLAAAFYFFDKRVKLRAYRCRRCGEVTCSRCSRSLTWGGLCPDCYRSFIRMEGVDPRERVSKLLNIYNKKIRDRSIANALTYLLPGSAQIYSGRIIEGFLFLWSFMFFVSLIVLNLTGLIWPYSLRHEWLNPVCLVFIVVIYFFSLIHMRGAYRREWH